MASTSLSSCSGLCPSFSLLNRGCHSSATSLSFQIPKKRSQIPFFGRKSCVFVHSIKRHELGYGCFPVGIPQIGAVDQTKMMVDSVNRITVKAAEVVAQTSEEQTSRESKTKKKGETVKYPRRILDVYQILQNPIITEAAIKSIANENALVFTVDVRADKKMIKDAFCNFFGVKVRKVNTSIRPDGTKKAFIMLSKEFNASEIAKSIGIFPK